VVRVIVLSKQTTLTRARASIVSPFLNKMPNLAATPVPTIIAVGAAKPRAQGQATTSTAMANFKANGMGCKESVTMPALCREIQTIKTAMPNTKIDGTNQAATCQNKRDEHWKIIAYGNCGIECTKSTIRSIGALAI